MLTRRCQRERFADTWMPLWILRWNENQIHDLRLCVCVRAHSCTNKLTLCPLLSYHNLASVCHAANALFLTSLIHAVQCMSVRSLNQPRSIYRPTVARTHRQWALLGLQFIVGINEMKNKREEFFLLLQQMTTKLSWLLTLQQIS